MKITKNSDYIVYVDNSGDHSLNNINKEYPIFVLVFCIFDKNQYLKTASQIKNVKFKYFGHDMVVLHESDIRRGKNYFSSFGKEDKANFLGSLTGIIKNQDFTVITAVIDKNKLKAQYSSPENPYHIAMKLCLERLYLFLQEKQNIDKTTTVVFEERCKKEDDALELEFRRWCGRHTRLNTRVNFNTISKKVNSAGLQLADLIARPIGLSYLKPQQDNRAFEIIKDKIFNIEATRVEEKGLDYKVFPDD